MRERGQATVESIALLAAVLALAAALVVGVVRLGPPLATTIAGALSGTFAPGEPAAPPLDALERALLAGATGLAPDGPTLLDLRTRLRSHLPPAAADAAFDAAVRLAFAPVLEAKHIDLTATRIEVVDRATQDAWLRRRFRPDWLDRMAHAVVGYASTPGSIYSLGEELGLVGNADAIPPGDAAGDLIVPVGAGRRVLILRRVPGAGLTLVSDRTLLPTHGGSK